MIAKRSENRKRFSAADFRFGIVAASWHAEFTDSLVNEALKVLSECGAAEKNIKLLRVPGSFEIPQAAMKMALSKDFDAIIALGTLIKGETDHYQLIAAEVARGIMEVSFRTGVPVSFGVITALNLEQAKARSSSGIENKGAEAALAAVEMANLFSS